MCIFLAQNIFAKEHTIRDNSSFKSGEPWKISAKSLSFDEKNHTYDARGDVVLQSGNEIIYAREAVYNKESGIVSLSGGVRFESGEDTLTGEGGTFNLNNRTGKIEKGSLFLVENNYYISGDTLEKVGENSYYLKNCRLTTCDGDSPAWYITGSEVKVTIEGYGKVKNATFRVKDVPVFHIPYIILPAKTKRQSGVLLPRMGYSGRNGLDVEIPVFWAISEQSDATFYERYMSHRGLMQGVEYRYITDNNSKGTIIFDILSDKETNNSNLETLSPFDRTNKTRYWVRSRSDHQLPHDIMGRLDTDYISDQEYLREFNNSLFGYDARTNVGMTSGRALEDIHSPTRRSALRLSRDREDYSLQAISEYNQRPETPVKDQTTQPIAGMDLAVLPRPLKGLPLSYSFDTDYDYVWRDFGQKGHRFSFTPAVTYPMWLGEHVELEPGISFTRNAQWLDNSTTDHQHRDAYKFHLRLSSPMDKVFDYKWKQITKLKHKIVPSLTYEYRAADDHDKSRPWFEPVDVEEKQNIISFSISNLLDAKKEDKKGNIRYSQIGSFSLSQGYSLDEADRDEEPWREKQPFEPLKALMTLHPFPSLDLDAETHWDHYDDDFIYADLSLELSIDRAGNLSDTYGIDYEYENGLNNALNYHLEVNLAYGFSAGAAHKRDFEFHETIEEKYWLKYSSQCWSVQLAAGELADVSSFMLTFELTGLGKLGS